VKLQHTRTLTLDLSKETLLVDSTALIDAAKSDEFLKLLQEISSGGCILVTIPSVVYEYTRTADTITEYNKRLDFISELGIVVLNRLEETAEKHQVFAVAYNKSLNRKEKGPSYTDALLCTTVYAYKHKNMMLLTANHKDIPSSIFDRTEFITIDISGDLRVEAIYKFSPTKFSKILHKLEVE
jgi:hypothetical protein